MEPTLIFSATDQSIDIVVAFLFIGAFFHSLNYLHQNHISVEGKIKLVFILVISSLHIYQVITQFTSGHAANFRVWDIINYLTAAYFLMSAHRIAKKEKCN